MKLLYFPDADVLSIKLPPDRFDGRDTNDPDITLFFDKSNRLSEILIENASTRTGLDALRDQPQFEEIQEEVRELG